MKRAIPNVAAAVAAANDVHPVAIGVATRPTIAVRNPRRATGSDRPLPAVFDGREVQPDQMINISGSLDKKSAPAVVRVTHLQK